MSKKLDIIMFYITKQYVHSYKDSAWYLIFFIIIVIAIILY
jgi:hypothetical protein